MNQLLSFEAAKTLNQALVISRLDYCISVPYGIPAIQTNKLQRVQNAAARLLTNTPRYSNITPVMVDLHWLPVKFRIILKVILSTFKAVHGIAPSYITSLLSLKQSKYNVRSVDNNVLGLLTTFKKQLKTHLFRKAYF